MKDLLKYFKGYIKESLLGPLFKFLEACFELLVPLLIAGIVDQTIPQKDSHHLWQMLLYLVIFAILGVVVAVTAQYFSSKAAVGFTRQLSQELYEKILKLPKSSRDRLGVSSLVTRLTSDTYQIQMGINQFLRLFLRAPIIVFGAIMMAFSIHPSITIWFVMMVLVLSFLIFILSRLVNPLYATMRNMTDTIVNTTRQQLQGMRVIRAFGQDKKEIQDFNRLNDLYKSWQIKTGVWASLMGPSTFLVVNVTLLAVIWTGNQKIQEGILSQGSLVALINYLLQILIELLKLAMLITSLNQSFISAKRIQEVFEEDDEDISKSLAQQEVQSDQAIQVQQMSFTYPEASSASLKGINFELKSGQTLGVIGGTGAGKSTLVQLLGHIYPVSDGKLAIFLNGKSPKNLKEWRSWVSVVPQKAELFQGTIRSNLTLGIPEVPTDAELWKALEIAQARNFVFEKDGGLDEPVEAFGSNFSGGQRQRLTIARAVLRRAPFLILDDATSALDYLTESKLLKAIHEELIETSLVLVSQRTNSLRSADQILVLDKGEQVALGKHEHLLEVSELYRQIHYSQHREEEV